MLQRLTPDEIVLRMFVILAFVRELLMLNTGNVVPYVLGDRVLREKHVSSPGYLFPE